jgi:arylsulfatase A-like enzyme
MMGFSVNPQLKDYFPRQPLEATSMDAVRAMIEGYDTGVLYADEYFGRLLAKLDAAGVLDETAIIVTGDHGETLGELNIYGDHQTADELTSHVPMIVRWPGVTDRQAGRIDEAFHYQFDVAATVLELVGARVPSSWDGVSFAEALRAGEESGRDYLVLSQAAWSCQRAVRFDDWICIRSYHDGYHEFPELMLFDLANDPHETENVAAKHPEVVMAAQAKLSDWHAEMMRTSTLGVDPMQTVLAEGGPFHTRGQLPKYLERLRATEREHWARALEASHPGEL